MSIEDAAGFETMATELFTRYWWLLALRGLAAVIFGVLAFVWPGITLFTLIIFFGAYALVNGILSLIMAFKAPRDYPRLTGFILPGLISIAAGLITLFLPSLTALTLLVLIAFWAIFTGIFEILLAVRLRKIIAHEWLLILAGVVSFLFGAGVLIAPGAGALALILWIGAFSIFFGVMLILAAFRVHQWGSHVRTAFS